MIAISPAFRCIFCLVFNQVIVAGGSTLIGGSGGSGGNYTFVHSITLIIISFFLILLKLYCFGKLQSCLAAYSVYLVDTTVSAKDVLKTRRAKLPKLYWGYETILAYSVGGPPGGPPGGHYVVLCAHHAASGASSAEGKDVATNTHRQCVVLVYA
jgi:uncharacterized membrane protein